MNHKSSYVIAVTGSSGSLYAASVIRALALTEGGPSAVIISEAAIRVYREEYDITVNNPEEVLGHILKNVPLSLKKHNFLIFSNDNIGAPPASGSAPYQGMLIVPCSMKTLSSVSHGQSSNLIERAADVILKERKKLIVMPRETPLSLIHLKNMTALTEAGAIVMPASPGFYSRPSSVDDLADFMAGRALSLLGVPNSLYPIWEG